jgi:DNA-binding GntR family transcriptional regulator
MGPTTGTMGPLYLALARTLSSEIASGVLPVGSRLPAETALARRFDVSRHTVRAALRHLRDLGFVSSRQGSRSTVAARTPDTGYVYGVSSLPDLLQYANETIYEIRGCDIVTADRALAARLGCRPGRRWLRVEGLRYLRRDEPPIGWVDFYLHTRYSDIRASVLGRTGTVMALVEERYGEQIAEVAQTLRAATVPKALADRLEVEAGTAALEIERTITSTRRTVIGTSFSLHPINRFSYGIVLRRESTGRPGAAD